MMTERENWFEVYNHGKPEWTPNLFDTYHYVETSAFANKGYGPDGRGGIDLYGVEWICTEDTGWMATPNPRKILFDFEDIENWRDYVQFPDVDSVDWAAAAKRDLEGFNRDEKVLVLWSFEGNFNRLQSMVGTAEALIAMVEEPEACKDFFDAHTKFLMDINDRIIEYYKPDVFAIGDDFAGADSMMISKDMYNELLKENEMKLGHGVLKHNVILEHHICGFAEPVIDDIIETGATIWSTAQPMNDLVGIQKRVGDKLMIDGGWNSTGSFNFDGASEESVRAESRRCLDTYFNNGFYQCMPVIVGNGEHFENRCKWAADELHNYSAELFKKMRK